MRLSSSIPISSPNRAEKFPPPLTRFHRSNGGSRSRGRSRSSPLFARKKNSAIETQEPSSPKVTCFGQVRVRRSKLVGAKASRTKLWCRSIRKAMLCNHCAQKSKPRTSRPVWPRWFVLFRLGYRRKVDFVEESAKRESERADIKEDSDPEDEEDEAAKARVLVSSSPPKNALLLMKCRSEPGRASSVANRFWVSPSGNEDAEEEKKMQEDKDHVETEEEEKKVQEDKDHVETEEEEKATSAGVPIYRFSAAESRTYPDIWGKLGYCEGFESSSSEKTTKTTQIKDETSIMTGDFTRPLTLTRCKSEPARATGQLDPETCFWKTRRLRFGEGCPPNVYN